MHRTFIALKLNPSTAMLDGIHEARKVLRDSQIKWVEPGNLHITLKFLGDTEPELLKQCSLIVREVAGKFEKPFAVFGGMGLFRNLEEPRVLWIGMEADRTFFRIQAEINRRMEPLGFQPEKRTYNPHLTIGRIKNLRKPEILRELTGRFEGIEFQEVSFSRLAYYESILRPEGPLYREIISAAFRD